LKRSILAWKQIHKFLSSQIVKLDNKYYFDFIQNSDTYNFENIHFLRLNDRQMTPSKTNESISKLLVDKCITDEIKPVEDRNTNKLLWRIYFFEILNSSFPQKFQYDLILNMHHSITQGQTGFLNLIKLLQLTQSMLRKEQVEIKVRNEVFPGCYSLFGDRISEPNRVSHDSSNVKMPSFLNPTRAQADSLSWKPPNDLNPNLEVLDVETRRKFASVFDLSEISRKNHMRYKTITFDQNFSARLLERCKKENMKLTSCIGIKKLHYNYNYLFF
jgi:hypothetical protein